jgi:hypothetical protein
MGLGVGLVASQSDGRVSSLLSAEAAPNALSPPVEPVSHKRKERRAKIDKHIQLKAVSFSLGPSYFPAQN